MRSTASTLLGPLLVFLGMVVILVDRFGSAQGGGVGDENANQALIAHEIFHALQAGRAEVHLLSRLRRASTWWEREGDGGFRE